MIFDRYSQCPECRMFTFLGEWITPKEYFFKTDYLIRISVFILNLSVHAAKVKKCTNCDKIIESLLLARPSSGKSLGL